MSSKEEVETKGGHLPAVKVGGVRITQRHRRESEETSANPPKPVPKEGEEEENEEEETEAESKSPPKSTLMVSGVPSKIERDYPTEAVKHTHEKPVPTHDYARQSGAKPIIQQPRK